jgi:hypothetical protein
VELQHLAVGLLNDFLPLVRNVLRLTPLKMNWTWLVRLAKRTDHPGIGKSPNSSYLVEEAVPRGRQDAWRLVNMGTAGGVQAQ